ncbi:MAG TPA: PBP1A family penicillin-binding protein [Actinomycetota bacterium]|nr:PBP1A family penicillin-binding protein [Actinomycetota bacterium]
MSATPVTRPRPVGSADPTDGEAWVASAPAATTSRRRRLATIVTLSLVLPLLSTTGAVVALYATTDLPEIPPLAQTTMLLDRDGKEVAALHAAVDRHEIGFADMPRPLVRAVVAVEDADFFRHDGVDPSAIVRATWANVTSGSLSQGGSTITQQYVKNVLTGAERSIARKVREAILAVKLEHTSTKREILEGYLNTVYLGHGAYGVQAAAKTYFGRDARELTALQSATLAGLIAAPSARDPFVHPAEATEARDAALSRMVEVGWLSATRARRLQARPLGLADEPVVRSEAAHFMEYVRRSLAAGYGLDAIYRGGFRVRTTLDTDWQRRAERAVGANLPARAGPEAALVAIDPRTGAIRAMVGGRDFGKSEFNLATQGRRQAGSAFKPFVLLAALEQGISPLELRDGPSTITIRDPFCETKGAPWTVSNAGDQWAGTMTLEQAMAGSVNTIYAQVTVEVGPEAVADVARRMGIRSRLAPVCSIGLGTSEVTPLEMTSAFATLAARGVYMEPTAIERVRGANGGILQGPLPTLADAGSQAVGTEHADAATRVLQGVVEHGTGTAAWLVGRPVAGKTGTAARATDAWFCGYVPQLATCVWVGYPGATRPMRDVAGEPEVYGGTIPARIWHDFMAAATAEMDVAGFAPGSYELYEDPPPPPPPSPPPAPDVAETPATSPSPAPEPSPAPTPGTSPKPSPTASPEPSPQPSKSPSPSSGGDEGAAEVATRSRAP